jgi:hypothetical protein
VKVLRVGVERHFCNLDYTTELPDGSLVQCEDCGRRYVVARIPWERTFRRAWPWEK